MNVRSYWNRYSEVVLLTLIIIFYLFDLGNLDALRQGTEGFYLQISKEMADSSSWLTPTYLGNAHWSKPPFHFWLPRPLYFIAGGATLFQARFAIFLLTFGLLLFTAKWMKRHYGLAICKSLIYLYASVGILKYCRIYMMEIPLALLLLCSALALYDLLRMQTFRSLLISSIFLALCTLVKGPVALAMAFGSLTLYLSIQQFLKHQISVPWIKLIWWATLSILFSSLWFLLCFAEYGWDFFNYFFLRENIGKFTAQSYPISSVVQGLLIFALPWTLFLPSLKPWVKTLINEKHPRTLFILSFFLFCFILWMIPSQRSHHYAMPAVPFFLLLVIPFIHDQKPKLKMHSVLRTLTAGLTLLLFLLLGTVLALGLLSSAKSWSLISALAILLTIGIILWRSRTLLISIFSFSLLLGALWTIIIPLFILPFFPQQAVKAVGQSELTVVVRKPYFVSEAIGREVIVSDPAAIKGIINLAKEGHFLLHGSLYRKIQNELKQTALVKNWPIWQRGRRVSHIIEAIKNRNLAQLQEDMVLLKKISKDRN